MMDHWTTMHDQELRDLIGRFAPAFDRHDLTMLNGLSYTDLFRDHLRLQLLRLIAMYSTTRYGAEAVLWSDDVLLTLVSELPRRET